MRSTNHKDPNISTDQVNHQTYRRICYLPFLTSIRENCTLSWEKGMALTDAMTAVGWQDGHGPSLKAATNKDVMARDEELKIITAKHAGSTTATTQAMDVGAQFKI